ncbi:MAG: metallophosphoesterase family protein [Chloroflexota bacterium]
MRIAIFSDIHGNLSAFRAVLENIDQQAPDLIVFAGDLCLVGPRPAQCVDLLRSRRITAVYGNTDDWVLGRQSPPERLQPLATWTLDQLSAKNREWLRNLPFAVTINPTAENASALTIVHANPQDVNQILFPPEDVSSLATGGSPIGFSLDSLLSGLKAQALAFGHLHIPSIRLWQNLLLINVSSVSMTGDGDPRAKYALVTWDGAQWSAEHIRVAYDVSEEIEAYRQTQPPGWQEAIQSLETYGTIPQRV